MDFGKWQQLVDVFLEWNQKLNLSAIRDAQGVYVKHVLDSVEVLKCKSVKDILVGGDPSLRSGGQAIRVCDVGTGGGFPLLPLAMSCPDVQFVGLDARRKKIDAINAMITELGLVNCQAIWSRIEEHKQQYDVVTARAVAHADTLIPWCMPLLKKGGKMVLYKEYKEEERETIIRLAKKFHLELEQEHRYRLEEEGIERVIYVLS